MEPLSPRWSVVADPGYYDLKTLIVDRDSVMALTVVAACGYLKAKCQAMEAFASEVARALNGAQDAIRLEQENQDLRQEIRRLKEER